jgi:ribosomal protein S25/predicted flap endonuclease-1-like 5' DNA nuclease
MIRRVIVISRKKWGRATVKTERIVREAIPKPEVIDEINQYLAKARSVTWFDLANRFNIRLSVAKKILREKEADGLLIPYVREGGFVVYTTKSELEKREVGTPVMLSDVLEEVASSVPTESVITEDMDAALAAASMATMKPSKLRRQRREFGERKERSRDKRPEIVVEPLAEESPPPEKRKKQEEREVREEISDAVAVEDVPPIADIKPKKAKPKSKPKKTAEKEEKKPEKKVEKKKPEIKHELPDIDGIGPSMQEKLKDAGYKTVLQLSEAKIEELTSKVDGIGESSAKKFVAAAKSLVSSASKTKQKKTTKKKTSKKSTKKSSTSKKKKTSKKKSK